MLQSQQIPPHKEKKKEKKIMNRYFLPEEHTCYLQLPHVKKY